MLRPLHLLHYKVQCRTGPDVLYKKTVSLLTTAELARKYQQFTIFIINIEFLKDIPIVDVEHLELEIKQQWRRSFRKKTI
jgi:hypothetical protein